MSEQELNPETPQDVFAKAIEEGESMLMGDDAPVTDDQVDEAPEGDVDDQQELDLNHQPTDDDPPEYWEAFARSKGWKNKDEIDDEANWKGYKAFVRDYDRIQDKIMSEKEVKELRRQQQEILKNQQELLKSATADKDAQLVQMRKELEAAKQKAKDNLDFEAYEQVSEELNKVNAQTAPKMETDENPIQELYSTFRNTNQELLSTSEAYDPMLTAAVETTVNEKMKSFYNKYNVLPTVDDVESYLSDALTQAKASLVKYQKPPQRKPPATQSVRNTGSDGKVKLDPGKLSPEERSFYDFYMKKGDKAIAEEFLKTALGA